MNTTYNMKPSLNRAKRTRNDEFYTRLQDIDREVCLYSDFFRGKSVYCNCDDYRKSNFLKFFEERFDKFGLKRLVATCHVPKGRGVRHEISMDRRGGLTSLLNGNGSFSSDECLEELDKADVVVTNPPFSLFREFFDVLVGHKKKFLVIGNLNAIPCKNVFS